MNIALLLVIIISKDFTIPKFYVIARLAGGTKFKFLENMFCWLLRKLVFSSKWAHEAGAHKVLNFDIWE